MEAALGVPPLVLVEAEGQGSYMKLTLILQIQHTPLQLALLALRALVAAAVGMAEAPCSAR